MQITLVIDYPRGKARAADDLPSSHRSPKDMHVNYLHSSLLTLSLFIVYSASAEVREESHQNEARAKALIQQTIFEDLNEHDQLKHIH